MKPLKSDPVDGLVRLDHFRVVGFIESASDSVVVVRIHRNPQPLKLEQRPRTFKPFRLRLEGTLPTEAVEQNWDLEVRREGGMLIVLSGHVYEPDAKDLAWLTQLKQQSTVSHAIAASPTADVSAENPALSLQPEKTKNQDNSEHSTAGLQPEQPHEPGQL